MAILLVFVVYEIQYNTLLEKTFKIIVHFNDFQNYFYHTALSILSLSCVADSFADTQCDNQYLAYSKSFIEENNLTENELFVVFISQELLFKSEEIVDHLKTWESEREYIKSDELSQILEKDFYFTGIEEPVSCVPGKGNCSKSDEVRIFPSRSCKWSSKRRKSNGCCTFIG